MEFLPVHTREIVGAVTSSFCRTWDNDRAIKFDLRMLPRSLVNLLITRHDIFARPSGGPERSHRVPLAFLALWLLVES